MRFEWSPGKAAANLAKHKVSFDEARTVFGDPLAFTIDDPDTSTDQNRLLTKGCLNVGGSWLWRTLMTKARFGSSALDAPQRMKGSMNRKAKTRSVGDMRPEYDFSSGVRGRFYKEYMKGTNVVLHDADVAEVFPDSQAVNTALRSLAELAKRQTKIKAKKAKTA